MFYLGGSHSRRWWRCAAMLVAVVALGAFIPLSASAVTSGPRQVKVIAAKTGCDAASLKSAATRRCAVIQVTAAGALSPAAREQRAQALARIAARSAKAKGKAIAAAGQAPADGTLLIPPPQCDFAGWWSPAQMYPDRFTSCGLSNLTLVDFNVDGQGIPEIMGTYDFETLQWNSFSVGSLAWAHEIIFFGLEGTGDLADGFTTSVFSSCGELGVCDAVNLSGPDPQERVVSDGSEFDLAWTESDTGPASTVTGQVDKLDNGLYGEVGVTLAGTSPNGSPFIEDDAGATFGGRPFPLNARCDSIDHSGDGGDGPPQGCVDEAFVPSLVLPVDTYGASASMIAFAQQRLSGAWGVNWNLALHYLGDPVITRNNREVICKDGSFINNNAMTAALAPYNIPASNYTETDSCDEYPFASTYESGAMTEDADGNAKAFVTTGIGCAQVTANQIGTSGTNEAADWKTVSELGTVIGSEPCVRGHIPNLLNARVGSSFGTLVQTDRFVDKDRFSVQVPSTQSFSAATQLAVVPGTVNGAAASGAGTFETSASQDSYAFTVPAGGLALNLNLNIPSCPTQGSASLLTWTLLSSSGTQVQGGSCGYSSLGTVAAGSYRLVVSAQGLAGTYALNMEAAQSFAVAVPLAVTAGTVNGTAAAGAGTFETVASQDSYSFTVPAGGAALNLNLASCPTQGSASLLTWTLLSSSGAQVQGGSCGYSSLGTVAAGSYRLVVSAQGLAGTYALNMGATSGAVTSGEIGLCLDDFHSSTAAGNKIDTFACNGTGAQAWTLTAAGQLQVKGGCATTAGTAAGSLVQFEPCNAGDATQQWAPQARSALVNPATGLCLDDPGGSTAGSQAEIASCTGGTQQQWGLARAATGFLASNVASKCADDFHSGTSAGNVIDIFDCNGSGAQAWTLTTGGQLQVKGGCAQPSAGATATGAAIVLEPCTAGTTAQEWITGPSGWIENIAASLCLSDPAGAAANGTQLDIEGCASAAGRLWRPATAAPSTGPLASGVAGKCADDFHSQTTPGNVIDIYDCNGTGAQAWTLTPSGQLQVKGGCAQPSAGATATGTVIVLEPCTAVTTAQEWAAGPNGWITSVSARLCLADPGSSTANGTQLDIEACTGAAGQQWTLPPTTALTPGT